MIGPLSPSDCCSDIPDSWRAMNLCLGALTSDGGARALHSPLLQLACRHPRGGDAVALVNAIVEVSSQSIPANPLPVRGSATEPASACNASERSTSRALLTRRSSLASLSQALVEPLVNLLSAPEMAARETAAVALYALCRSGDEARRDASQRNPISLRYPYPCCFLLFALLPLLCQDRGHGACRVPIRRLDSRSQVVRLELARSGALTNLVNIVGEGNMQAREAAVGARARRVVPHVPLFCGLLPDKKNLTSSARGRGCVLAARAHGPRGRGGGDQRGGRLPSRGTHTS